MPAALTYDSLVSDLRSYAERPNDERLLEQAPRLIMMAENRIATDLRILGTQLVVESTLPSNTLAKPAYWRRTESIALTHPTTNERVPVLRRSYEFCRAYEGAAARPRYYADYNFDNFLFSPTPDVEYELELVYVGRLPPLSDANQTNWFTANAPQLILNAALLEMEIWLKNFRNAETRKSEYATSLAAFKTEESARVFDRSGIVISPT